MKIPKALLQLHESQQDGRFAEFVRSPDSYESLTGYLLARSTDCFLLKLFNWDCFEWEGKCIIWASSVREIRPFQELEWPTIAARKRSLTERVTILNIRQHAQGFFRTQLAGAPFVLVEREGIFPGELLFCRVLEIGRASLHADSYDRNLQIISKVSIPYRDITKITFDDGYSKAASGVLAIWKKRKP